MRAHSEKGGLLQHHSSPPLIDPAKLQEAAIHSNTREELNHILKSETQSLANRTVTGINNKCYS